MKEEMILVVRRALFDELGSFQGLQFDVDRYLPPLLERGNNFFTARTAAETNIGLKQIIPYVLLVHEDRVLHYVRGKKAGEQRLVAKGSIGIGGHFNETHETLFSWDEGASRAGGGSEGAEEGRIGAALGGKKGALPNRHRPE